MLFINHTLKFVLLLQLIFSAACWAEEIRVYTDQVPNAQELGGIMFPELSSGNAQHELTRSIKFVKKSDVVNKPNDKQKASESPKLAMPITFDFDSFIIKPESYPYLNEIGKMLMLENYRQKTIVIEGHTDAVGAETYNIYLSANRAESVKKYLMDKYQVAPERLKVYGKGENALLPGIQPDNSMNRRVQFYRAD